MKLTFIGADHEVTGSCHCLEICGKHILIDYGMQQGKDIYVNQGIPWPESDIDYVLLTHAHIDHAGLLPLLYARGFRGTVFCTTATADLCDIMLRDSAHIQEFEADWRNHKGRRAGAEDVPPLYSMEDAIGLIKHIEGVPYDVQIDLCEGVQIRFRDEGHLLGSSSIEVWLTENNQQEKIVFSGDIGNIDQPLIRNPFYIEDADYVVMESTYGDRTHDKPVDYVTALAEILQTTFDRGGNVVVPSFAVGRTQEMLYYIREIKKRGLIQRHGNFDVYVDSPLAVEATNIFQENMQDCYDEETLNLVRSGINPLNFPGLHLSITSDESRAINFDLKPKVILSASGMCEAGRIRHHLKHNLWRPESTILFVGYQAFGTLGRILLDGVTEVKLFGETIDVRASILRLPGMSGHADQNGLIEWINHFTVKPKKVFIVHGEDQVCDSFAQLLTTQYGYDTGVPFSGAEFDLATDSWISQPIGIPVPDKSPVSKRSTDAFARLLAAGQRLLAVINRNKAYTNKDLARFTDQVNNLSDRWDHPLGK
ncbi:MAG: MBL fold metallo-hydrolase [Lachnospiraceae bacterium]